jgi:hypothetical protein
VSAPRIVRYDNGSFRIDLDEAAAQKLVRVLVTIEQALDDEDWQALEPEMGQLRDAMIDLVPPPEDA